MKRIIKASDTYSDKLRYHDIFYVGKQKYSVHYSAPYYPDDFYAQIREIHPYDESEYVWARIGYTDYTDDVEFIKDGRVIYVDDSLLGYYDPDKWGYGQAGCKSFWEDMIQIVCEQLKKYNEDIEPSMSHY